MANGNNYLTSRGSYAGEGGGGEVDLVFGIAAARERSLRLRSTAIMSSCVPLGARYGASDQKISNGLYELNDANAKYSKVYPMSQVSQLVVLLLILGLHIFLRYLIRNNLLPSIIPVLLRLEIGSRLFSF
jgi:hypothetical protein